MSAEPALTRRQREILDLAARGLSDKQIARRLGISPSTIKNHFMEIYRILPLGDAGNRRVAAVRWWRASEVRQLCHDLRGALTFCAQLAELAQRRLARDDTERAAAALARLRAGLRERFARIDRAEAEALGDDQRPG